MKISIPFLGVNHEIVGHQPKPSERRNASFSERVRDVLPVKIRSARPAWATPLSNANAVIPSATHEPTGAPSASTGAAVTASGTAPDAQGIHSAVVRNAPSVANAIAADRGKDFLIGKEVRSPSSKPGPLHQAILDKDIQRVQTLMSEGKRPNELDADRRTPLDLLDTFKSRDIGVANALRSVLLASKNSSAPIGYTKPEAFHGSPWGVEIFQSGELRGGANDAKGGSASLEGKVFFSDRTPATDSDTTVRNNLRTKARSYATGSGIQTSSAGMRGAQYRMVQALQHTIEHTGKLNTSGEPITITVDKPEQMEDKLKSTLQELFTTTAMWRLRDFKTIPLDEIGERIQLPKRISVHGPEGEKSYSDAELHALYKETFQNLKTDLENGKAPFLNLINNAYGVPITLGFEKVSKLKKHKIPDNLHGPDKNFSYQDGSHPLSGSEHGGKLKELEVKSLKDLSTLLVGTMAKSVHLPDDLVFRVNPNSQNKKKDGEAKAHYLTSDQVQGFRENLIKKIADKDNIAVENVPAHISQASIASLQNVVSTLRNMDLENLVPARA